MLKQYDLIRQLERRAFRWPTPRVLLDEQPRQQFDGMESRAPVGDERPDYVNCAGFSTLTAKIATVVQWSAQNNITGLNPLSQTQVIQKQYAMASSVGNTTTGGGDLMFSFQQAITAGSSATINLASMTSVLQIAATVPARIKSCQIRLLSASDDPTITPAPNSASTVTVTNNGPATPHPLYFAMGGSGLTVAATATGGVITGVSIGTAGSGYIKSATFLASPQQAGGSGCVFAVTTNGSGVPTAVTFIAGAGGAGYTAATLPTVVVGQFTLTTGNAQANIDVTGSGVAVSSTSCNISIRNNDGSNAVTVEVDLFGAFS